ncbi:MAG: PDZ domain-containing protein [Planctomycetes bacterium]|nr:PDZ domain-containing protein [Planctomycetota bacterium]
MCKKFSVLLLVFAFVFVGVTFSQDADKIKAKRPGYMGINMELAANLTKIEGCDAKHGVRLTMVTALSPAQKAGLQVGDIIYSVDEQMFTDETSKIIEQFRGMLAKYFAGDALKLKIIREIIEYEVFVNGKKVKLTNEIIAALEEYMLGQDLGTELNVKAKKYSKLIDISVILGDRYDAMGALLPSDKKIYPMLAGKNSPEGEFAEKLVKHYEIDEVVREIKEKVVEDGKEVEKTRKEILGYKDLRTRLANLAVRHEGFKLNDVAFVQRNPFQIEKIADIIRERISAKGSGYNTLMNQLTGAMQTLNVEFRLASREPLKTELSGEKHLSQIESVLKVANGHRDRAFKAFTADEMKFMEETLYKLGEKLQTHMYIHINFPQEHRTEKEFQVLLADFLKLIELAKKIDYAQLLYARQSMLQLADSIYINSLVADLQKGKHDLTQKIVLERNTPFGKIAIAGTGHNEYGKFVPSRDEKGNWKRSPYAQDYAVLIDLGGDDFYANNAGSSNGTINCAILVDLAGNDAYESTRDYVQGTGFMGVGALVDFKGDDTYIGINWSQATAMMGIGCLLDVSGDDTYRAQYFSQAAGIWGVAQLVDGAGNDRYEGHCYMHGLGMPKCVAVLTDMAGDDNYYCKGRKPSSYGTLGLYEGWGQGAGLGLRMFASGGIGILHDMQGKDKYEVGIFGQGGGYYHGWGMLFDDGKEDDVYIGGRYAQGFAAHQALGTFIEEGGNDKYYSRNGVMSGLSWDETVVLFIDKAGDDWYQGGGFSLGATAHNGICIFKDLAGKDYYGSAPGRAGGNNYHGGSSLSVFLDFGGDEDTYASKGFNNKIHFFPEYGIVADLKSSKLEYDEDMLVPMKK